ncbi:MAG TPA: AAA family ATPase, partial [Egibacteraceae bacterium]|nr:AAA family ATPase [Egibacteraceae bacterium]
MDPLKTEEPQQGWAAAGPALLESIWRYRWLVLSVTVFAGLIGFAASHLQATVYEAGSELVLQDPSMGGVFQDTPAAATDRYIRNQAQVAGSAPVAEAASERLDGRFTPGEIMAGTRAEAGFEVDVLTIRARASTGEAAAEMANAVALAYEDVANEDVQRGSQDRIDQLNERIADLKVELGEVEAQVQQELDQAGADTAVMRPADIDALLPAGLRADRARLETELESLGLRLSQLVIDLGGESVVRFRQEARAPATPTQPRPARNGAAAALLGLFGSSALAWWKAEHSRVAERRQDPAPVLRAPLLGQVPDFKAAGITGVDPTRTAPHSAPAEAYQFIISSLQHALQQSGSTSVLVTSASPADGKTVTALNLAVAAARDGRRVLLADGDGRAMGLTSLADVAPSPGLTDLADMRMPFEGCVASISTPGETLSLVPAGTHPHDPAGFFRTPGFRKAMTRIKERADLVIIDTPPLLAVSDTSAIAGQVDGIVIVVSRGTSLNLLEEMRERLEFVGTPVLGYVFNRSVPRSGYGYGAYGYGYGYGYDAEGGAGSAGSAGTIQRAGNGSGNGHTPPATPAPPTPDPTPLDNPHRR